MTQNIWAKQRQSNLNSVPSHPKDLKVQNSFSPRYLYSPTKQLRDLFFLAPEHMFLSNALIIANKPRLLPLIALISLILHLKQIKKTDIHITY